MRLTRLGVILITVFAMQGVTGSPVGLRPEGHARLADAAYAEKIKAYTTGERFLSQLKVPVIVAVAELSLKRPDS